ncbi:hypothetical protein [Aurantiacibacter hainanensis]|uniref:hypothetical protein n=1 Tax=Aurantiacibacter hainanensis TaxID=3076114 RepID=UPI0030C6CCF4
MMKSIIPILVLAGGVPATAQDAMQDSEQAPPPQIETDAPETPVIDPDNGYNCEDDPVLVQGAEGDAQLYRDPARPDTLEPMHAVDYEVNGCSLIVMTDGSLVRPTDTDERVRLTPAQ